MSTNCPTKSNFWTATVGFGCTLGQVQGCCSDLSLPDLGICSSFFTVCFHLVLALHFLSAWFISRPLALLLLPFSLTRMSSVTLLFHTYYRHNSCFLIGMLFIHCRVQACNDLRFGIPRFSFLGAKAQLHSPATSLWPWTKILTEQHQAISNYAVLPNVIYRPSNV